MSGTSNSLRARPVLQLRMSGYADDKGGLLRRAIATRTCVVAVYNRGRVKLAPYILYNRDDTIFLDALTVERDGRPPREPKLGTFRLSGLGELCQTIELFEPQIDLEPGDPRYAAGILARI